MRFHEFSILALIVVGQEQYLLHDLTIIENENVLPLNYERSRISNYWVITYLYNENDVLSQ